MISHGEWRREAARIMQTMPPPVRRTYWGTRRRLARASRRARERRGDFSRSRPASYGLDDLLADRLGARPGYFVEAGAFDGFTQSNTYYLERALGWRGLLVEPVPALAREARRERPDSVVVNCALVATDYLRSTVELRYGGTMTIVASEPDAEDWAATAQRNMALDEPEHVFSVAARTLSSVLDEVHAPEVDLLSLDVEGYESQVLAGLDLDRHAPRFVLVEVDQRSGRDAVDSVLDTAYRPPEQLSPFDLLYERR